MVVIILFLPQLISCFICLSKKSLNCRYMKRSWLFKVYLSFSCSSLWDPLFKPLMKSTCNRVCIIVYPSQGLSSSSNRYFLTTALMSIGRQRPSAQVDVFFQNSVSNKALNLPCFYISFQIVPRCLIIIGTPVYYWSRKPEQDFCPEVWQ